MMNMQMNKHIMLTDFTNNYLYFDLFLPLYCPSLLVFTTFKMSINPQFQGHDQYDVMKGSVSAHFAEIVIMYYYGMNASMDSIK